jgi:hypothetical protein
MQQVGGYLGYTDGGADAFEKAARDQGEEGWMRCAGSADQG